MKKKTKENVGLLQVKKLVYDIPTFLFVRFIEADISYYNLEMEC